MKIEIILAKHFPLQQLNLNEKRGSIDGAIAKRCIEKLVVLTRMWPRHLDTWALRIKFTEFLGWKEEVCYLDNLYFFIISNISII